MRITRCPPFYFFVRRRISKSSTKFQGETSEETHPKQRPRLRRSLRKCLLYKEAFHFPIRNAQAQRGAGNRRRQPLSNVKNVERGRFMSLSLKRLARLECCATSGAAGLYFQ